VTSDDLRGPRSVPAPPSTLELYREPGDEHSDITITGSTSEIPIGFNERAPSRPRERACRIITVTGAKGGVGKTIFATNLSLYLATIGRSVVLVDADGAGSNVRTALGLPFGKTPPRRAGSEAPEPLDRVETATAFTDSGFAGLQILNAQLDHPMTAAARASRRRKLLANLPALDCDYAVIDLGSGIDHELVDLYLAADTAAFLVTPDPMAIENTYRFARAAFARRLRQALADDKQRASLTQHLSRWAYAPSPVDLVEHLRGIAPELRATAESLLESFSLKLVVNQVRVRADLELGELMRTASRQRLGVLLDYLGYIDFDDTVWSCLRSRRPLLIESPGSKASRNIEKLSRKVLAIDNGKLVGRPARTAPVGTHHDLLEVNRGATEEEVRRAYKRIREIYTPDALCCQGLFDAAELDGMQAKVEEAYDVLLDPARRRPYELSVFPNEPDLPDASSEAMAKSLENVPIPDISPETEFDGSLLRAVRESMGLDLRDISQRTKISTLYLRAIEDEAFETFPATVYVRGFVAQIAKCLRLDAPQVTRTYMRRVRMHMERRSRTA
jgi:flagellar biosynthesis protein FlhG